MRAARKEFGEKLTALSQAYNDAAWELVQLGDEARAAMGEVSASSSSEEEGFEPRSLCAVFDALQAILRGGGRAYG